MSSHERLNHTTDSHSQDTEDNTINGSHQNIKLETIRGPGSKYYHPIHRLPETHTDAEDSNNDDMEKGQNCSPCACPTSWTQKLTGLPVFVMCYGIAGIWMMTLGSLLGSQITSIERHLGLSSSKTGLILSSNDIGYLIAVLFGSHIGKYTHIPRCLSVSGLVFGISAIVMSFGRLEEPRVWRRGLQNNQTTLEMNQGIQFLCSVEDYTSYMNSSSGVNITHGGAPSIRHASSSGQPMAQDLSWAFWVFVVSAVVGGMVKSYRIPLLTHYVESNIQDKSRSGMYLGSSFTAMVFGPPVALLLGSYVSSLPVDLQETTMSKFDQRWVGAWWLGFIIVGSGSILFSLPVMFFPKHVKTAPEKMKTDKETNRMKSVKKVFIDMPKSLARIFRRPVYILALVGGCLEGFAFSGWFSFSQKYIETQFNKTPQQVSMTTGIIIIFTLAGGTFLGGYLSSRLKLELRGCTIYTLVICGVSAALDSLYLIFGCDNSEVMGLGDSSTVSSEACGCSSQTFFVCGDNNVDYRSPCLAGCTNVSNMVFSNCSEIMGGQARPGLCALGCPNFIPFMVVYSLSMLIGCSGIVPGFLMVVRSVESVDQSLATGASAFCQTLIGMLPAPILFGKLIDSTCRLWSVTSGYCMLYDRVMFRYYFNGIYIGLRIAHVIVLIFLLLIVQRQGKRENSTTTPEVK
nr:solute carrier organic anion transporter family member 1B3-like [Biomphalaria glabrata]